MVSTLTGAILNIILDLIFIFAFHWGMMGAAVATVAGQAVTAALAIAYTCRMKMIKPRREDFALVPAVCKKSLALGVPSLLPQVSIVAAMAAGCIPVVGFNMGAGQHGRVMELLTRLLIAEAIVGALSLVMVEVFPCALIGIFGAANESQYYTDFALGVRGLCPRQNRKHSAYICAWLFPRVSTRRYSSSCRR